MKKSSFHAIQDISFWQLGPPPPSQALHLPRQVFHNSAPPLTLSNDLTCGLEKGRQITRYIMCFFSQSFSTFGILTLFLHWSYFNFNFPSHFFQGHLSGLWISLSAWFPFSYLPQHTLSQSRCHHCQSCFYHKQAGVAETWEMSPVVTAKWKCCKQAIMMTQRMSYHLWIVERYPQSLVNNYSMG